MTNKYDVICLVVVWLSCHDPWTIINSYVHATHHMSKWQCHKIHNSRWRIKLPRFWVLYLVSCFLRKNVTPTPKTFIIYLYHWPLVFLIAFNLMSMSHISLVPLDSLSHSFFYYCVFQDLLTKKNIGKNVRSYMPHYRGKVLLVQSFSLLLNFIDDMFIPLYFYNWRYCLIGCESCQFAKHHCSNSFPRVNKKN